MLLCECNSITVSVRDLGIKPIPRRSFTRIMTRCLNISLLLRPFVFMDRGLSVVSLIVAGWTATPQMMYNLWSCGFNTIVSSTFWPDLNEFPAWGRQFVLD